MAEEPANRRVVDDGATSLLPHLEQLVFHTIPNAAEIDRIHAVEILAARIGGFCDRALYAGGVEGPVPPSEGGDNPLDHGRHPTLVSDVAAHADRLMAGGDQVFFCRSNRSLIEIRERHPH